MEKSYEFDCDMNNDYKDYYCCDEWGCAYIWLDESHGAEYNFCIDNGNNCSAIYKSVVNDEGYLETDYSAFEHYEIDFNNANWEMELEKAMFNTAKKFFG